jgi:hypothetical protein
MTLFHTLLKKKKKKKAQNGAVLNDTIAFLFYLVRAENRGRRKFCSPVSHRLLLPLGPKKTSTKDPYLSKAFHVLEKREER